MADDPTVSIKCVNPPELGVPPGYSQIVVVRGGHIIFIAGQTALDRNGGRRAGLNRTACRDAAPRLQREREHSDQLNDMNSP